MVVRLKRGNHRFLDVKMESPPVFHETNCTSSKHSSFDFLRHLGGYQIPSKFPQRGDLNFKNFKILLKDMKDPQFPVDFPMIFPWFSHDFTDIWGRRRLSRSGMCCCTGGLGSRQSPVDSSGGLETASAMAWACRNRGSTVYPQNCCFQDGTWWLFAVDLGI